MKNIHPIKEKVKYYLDTLLTIKYNFIIMQIDPNNIWIRGGLLGEPAN
jgi:hypothetical protein